MNIWLCYKILSSLNKQASVSIAFYKLLALSPLLNRLADNHFTNHFASIHKHTPALSDKKVQRLHLPLGSACIGGASLSHTYQSRIFPTYPVSSSTFEIIIVG